MAEFSIPFATNVLPTPVNAQIAAGSNFDWISRLPDSYWAGLQQEYAQRNRNLFQGGVPSDPGQLAAMLLRAGGAPAANEAVQLQQLQFGRDLLSQPTPEERYDRGAGVATPGRTALAPPSSEGGATATVDRPGAVARDVASSATTARSVAEANGANPHKFADSLGIHPDDPLDLQAQRGPIVAALRAAQASPQVSAFAAPDQPAAPFEINSGVLTPTTALAGPAAPLERPAGAPAEAPNVRVAGEFGAAAPMMSVDELRANVAREEALARDYQQRASAAAAGGKQLEPLAAQLGQAAQYHRQQATDARNSLMERSKATAPELQKYTVDTEAAKADQAAYQKKYTSTTDTSQAAQGILDRIDILKPLTTDPNYYSGPLSKNVLQAQRFRAAFGHDPSAAVPAEAFQKEVNDLLQTQIKALAAAGVGRVNLREVQIAQKSLGTLDNTAEGNRAQLELLRRASDQQVRNGAVANQIDRLVAAGRIPIGERQRRLNEALENVQTPMISPLEKEHPTLLGAVDAPANYLQMSQQQARAWQRDHGVRPNDPLRLGDRYVHAIE